MATTLRLISLPGQYDAIPVCLFEQPKYFSLSLDAKLLYSRLLSLTGASGKNGYEDNKGIYIFMNRNTIIKHLQCAPQKALKVFRELISFNLLERGENDKHYLRKAEGITTLTDGDLFHSPHRLHFSFWRLPRDLSTALSAGARLLYAKLTTLPCDDEGTINIPRMAISKLLGVDSRTLAGYITQLFERDLLQDRSTEKMELEKENSPAPSSNDTGDNSKPTCEDYTQLPVQMQPLNTPIDPITRLKKQVDYDYLKRFFPSHMHSILDRAFEILFYLRTNTDYMVYIGRTRYLSFDLKRILYGFKGIHLRQVVEACAKQTRVYDLEAYLRTLLVNSMFRLKEQLSASGRSKQVKATHTAPIDSAIHTVNPTSLKPGRQERKDLFKMLCDRLVE